MKLWEKKYQLNKQIEAYTVDNDYIIDQKLVKYDCQASIAHVKMLEKIGILSTEETDKLIMALYEIIKLDNNGAFIIEQEDEDCHTAIENFLIKKLGDTGKKVHTARSRNDQVLTALRLFYKDEIDQIILLIDKLIQIMTGFKNKKGNVKIPGYTHMQKAMPSSIAMWTDAFIESMIDNKKILLDIKNFIDQSPLGAGAGYGLPIKVDKQFTAELLDFKKVQKNPIYTQNSRGKFESSIIHGLSMVMFDLNKIATDLIMFSMSEFGFFKLPDEICIGSSIMPQKKNPDVLELLRAKYHNIISYEFEIKSIISNLTSGYNRDFQLTKNPTINSFQITIDSLEVLSLVFEKLMVNEKNCEKAMTDEIYATEKAYELVKKGVPFRDAYKKILKEY